MAKYHIIPEQRTLWQHSVIDKDLTSPPASPTKGNRYLIYGVGSGDWSGHDGDITYYDGSNWQFITKKEGMIVWVQDENEYYYYDGTNWGIYKKGLFEIDVNGGLMPITEVGRDDNFELDANDDITPKA